MVGAVQTYRHTLFRRVLHWISAVLLLCLLIVGVFLVRGIEITPETVETSLLLFSAHKTFGLIVFLLAVIRLVTHFVWPLPDHLHARHEQFASSLVHHTLLVAVLAMPIFGLMVHLSVPDSAPLWVFQFDQWKIADPERADLFAHLHTATAIVIVLCLAAHIAGALKHHFLDGDETLIAMIDGREFPVERSPFVARFASVALALLILTGACGAVLFLENQKVAQPAAPSDGNWIVAADKSKLRIKAHAGGIDINAEFQTFSSSIFLEPDTPETAKIEITVDTTSFRSGVKAADDTVINRDWLFAEEFPTAVWQSENVKRLDDGTYIAEGELTIRDVSAPVALNFSLTLTGEEAVGEGKAMFDRRDINLGRDSAAKETVAKFPIEIEFILHATRKASP